MGGAARAHDVMGTIVFADLGEDGPRLDLEIPIDELRSAFDASQQIGVAALPASEPEVMRYVADHTRVRAPDGRAYGLTPRSAGIVLHDDRNWLQVAIELIPPPGAATDELVLDTDLIDHRVVSHRIFVFLRDRAHPDAPALVATLHYQRHEVVLHRASGPPPVAIGAMVRLGMAHIAGGSDHLLFLLTLLLPAGLGIGAGRWRGRRDARAAVGDVARTVTAFTIGHSLTLAIGALGLAHLPSAVVESLIAVSILISAAHAITPIFPRREAWVGLGFGLVHGLGFASALADLGATGGHLVWAVLGFNLGVELMQLAVLAVTLPSLYVLHGTRLAVGARITGAVVAAVAAAAWLAERALGVTTPVPALVDRAFAHGPWLVLGLAALAAGARLWNEPAAQGSAAARAKVAC